MINKLKPDLVIIAVPPKTQSSIICHLLKNNIDFMVTATILVNSDEVFNDDAYEYDEVGIPFLAQLGRELYQLELERKR